MDSWSAGNEALKGGIGHVDTLYTQRFYIVFGAFPSPSVVISLNIYVCACVLL